MNVKDCVKYFLWFYLFLGSYICLADDIDVYGTSDENSKKILNAYGQSLLSLEKKKLLLNIQHRDNTSLKKTYQQLIDNIKHQFKLSSVNVDTVFYPHNQQLYTTINICDPKVTHGLSKGAPEKPYRLPQKPDVVDNMYAFTKKALDFLIAHPQYANRMDCKDYHCITPEHTYFAKDLAYFRAEVPRRQSFIQYTIVNDPNLARRRSAIFLLGFLRKPDAIAANLQLALQDKNSFIRHDALRVFGELYIKYPHVQVPVHKVIDSTYSCDEAERNKALILLNAMAEDKQYQPVLIKEAGAQLVRLLKLKQPNNHDEAYQILRKISNKDYPEYADSDWQNWLQRQALVQ